MTIADLLEQIHLKKSFLCIGLDPDLEKIPQHLLKEEDPVFAFNKAIIDAAQRYAVAFKPNLAFYEAQGEEGYKALRKTINYLNSRHPEIFTIADAKRGDIGNTAGMYAEAFFEDLDFDSVTVAPYMGRDSVEPFLEYRNKFTILLALTSNPGAYDFQVGEEKGEELYKKVLRTSKSWKNSENLMYVVGATKAEYLREIRKIVPDNFLLIPGVGAQGGSIEEVCRHGMNEEVGLLINASRAVLYASEGRDFASAAAEKARELQQQMAAFLE